MCYDTLPPTPEMFPSGHWLNVRRGELLKLTGSTKDAPRIVRVDGRPVPASDPMTFSVDLPSGDHLLSVLVAWARGDASYTFALHVL